jgi:hypothetical protein
LHDSSAEIVQITARQFRKSLISSQCRGGMLFAFPDVNPVDGILDRHIRESSMNLHRHHARPGGRPFHTHPRGESSDFSLHALRRDRSLSQRRNEERSFERHPDLLRYRYSEEESE